MSPHGALRSLSALGNGDDITSKIDTCIGKLLSFRSGEKEAVHVPSSRKNRHLRLWESPHPVLVTGNGSQKLNACGEWREFSQAFECEVLKGIFYGWWDAVGAVGAFTTYILRSACLPTARLFFRARMILVVLGAPGGQAAPQGCGPTPIRRQPPLDPGLGWSRNAPSPSPFRSSSSSSNPSSPAVSLSHPSGGFPPRFPRAARSQLDAILFRLLYHYV
jgi:hypothetical protein